MRVKILLLLGAVIVALTGCATSASQYYQSIADTNAKQAAMADARARAETERYRALAKIAENGDPATRAAVAMALALTGRVELPRPVVPQQPRSEALQWASVLVPSITNLGVGYYNAMTQRRLSDNTRSVAISTNEAFAAMGSSVATAGTAGYPYVQAPAANVATTTNTTTENYNEEHYSEANVSEANVTTTETTSDNSVQTTSTSSSTSSVGDYSGTISDSRFDSDDVGATVVIPDGFSVSSP